MRIATRTSWQTIPMPNERAELKVEKRYVAKHLSRIKNGFIPQQMEDKWFIFFENNFLHFHRSWTGVEIFQVELTENADRSAAIKHCWVNRDLLQYNFQSDEYDSQLVCCLIDSFLLDKKVDWPRLNM
jgi:hypothetical protein